MIHQSSVNQYNIINMPKSKYGLASSFCQDDEDSASCYDSEMENKVAKPMPCNFHLTPYTVIIGKGKLPKENLGNRRLRVLASNFVSRYADATGKRGKTEVVNEIIDSIKSAGGCFVKRDKHGQFHAVTTQAIREKIGYIFRDLLSDRYRSSSKSKAMRRHREQLDRASQKLQRAMSITSYARSFPVISTRTTAVPEHSFCLNRAVAEEEDLVPAAPDSMNSSPSALCGMHASQYDVLKAPLFG